MATITAGRIAFWEGGSLWGFRRTAGRHGPTRDAKHADDAFQLTFSVGGVFNLHFEDRTIHGPFAIGAPDTPHAFEAHGLVALLFIEPESPAGRSLLQSVGADSVTDDAVSFRVSRRQSGHVESLKR